MTREKPPSPPRTPPRKGASGITAADPGADINPNPEVGKSPRTLELATDQSLAARNLIYNPNEASLEVVKHCAEGVSAIAKRLTSRGDDSEEVKLEKDEVIIGMSARLMNGDELGNGGTAGIAHFRRDIVNVSLH